ncbi:MAG: GGDEF domain-containing protein [Rubrivivax sp.]|nr:GGDEF domain-containing protein [Rubrivivax sp.]
MALATFAAAAAPGAGRTASHGGAAALRHARRAWRLLHTDTQAAARLAGGALVQAQRRGDTGALAWAHLVRGFLSLYLATPAEALVDLERAECLFGERGDDAGRVLAATGRGRATWRSGRAEAALQQLLTLREEGLRLLKNEQRGVLLNAIAGCYSALGDSRQAFAYLHEALRGAGARRDLGFDTVLYCNLAHELMQLGDLEQALEQVALGLERSEGMSNARLRSVLLINRITCLAEAGRADEAWPDIERLLALPPGAGGRGTTALHFETLALAALRSGRVDPGRDLIARAEAGGYIHLPDERVELALARALLAQHEAGAGAGLRELDAAAPWVHGEGQPRASLRVRCLHAELAAQLHEAAGDAAGALGAMRRLQALAGERARALSAARAQAVLLQAELLRLRHRLEEHDARRRATERARAELARANEALSRKIVEVESLQAALHEQATHDALTGLFNRRHLEDTLPAMLALAGREGHALAAVVIDLDHFKAINDQHGHDAGDRLLAEFGRMLREHLRRSDLAFRYGGEEFCLLMPHTTAPSAGRKVGELLERWQRASFQVAGAALSGLGFSAGVADTTEEPASAAALLKLADQRLLCAKRSGRGRVLHAMPAPAR